jgi:hypothetical protein
VSVRRKRETLFYLAVFLAVFFSIVVYKLIVYKGFERLFDPRQPPFFPNYNHLVLTAKCVEPC